MKDQIPTLAIVNPRMSVLDLVVLAKPGKPKADLRKFIAKTGVELNGDHLAKPDDELFLKTNDVLRTGKGEWFRIEVVRLNDLETERLHLKSLEVQDVDMLQKYLPEWEIVKYLTTPESMKKGAPAPAVMESKLPPKVSKQIAQEVFKRVIMQPEPKNEFLWKIMQKVEPEKIIGVAHLQTDSVTARENIWLDPDMRDDNLVSEAMSAINEYAFSGLGVNNILFQQAFSHAAAPKEMEMLKLRFVGLDAAARFRDDPVGTWGMTKDGWDKMKEWLRPDQSVRQRRTRQQKEDAIRQQKMAAEPAARLDSTRVRKAETEKKQAEKTRAEKQRQQKIHDDEIHLDFPGKKKVEDDKTNMQKNTAEKIRVDRTRIEREMREKREAEEKKRLLNNPFAPPQPTPPTKGGK